MFQKILVAVENKKSAKRLIEYIIPLAQQFDSTVALIHVLNPPLAFGAELAVDAVEAERELTDQARMMLSEVRRFIPLGIAVQQFVEDGSPSERISDTASDWHADVVVVGDHNRGAFSRFLLGSTADAVIRRAPCPVLVVREPEDRTALGAHRAERPAEAVVR